MDIRPYRMDPAAARQSIEAGEAVVLDLTSPLIGTAVRGRIPGALWVSPRDILDRNRHAADLVRDCPTSRATRRSSPTAPARTKKPARD